MSTPKIPRTVPTRVARANSPITPQALQAVNKMRGTTGMDARRALFFELRAQIAQMTDATSDARSEGK